MVGATGIQYFAAGAALCSASLGTTFTVLATRGVTSTRLGSVLSTAAMIDDIVGLVTVQITKEASFIAHTGLLLALLVGASYASASVPLAAYLSGFTICW
ncbi:hypothetical protein DL767_008437 [Monosporascus sp. MG133]|nr:hypothetical protein DL767_008437 [Monosporascus sp. MG133]